MVQERAMKIIAILEKHFPDARLLLNYRNPFELLVVTILAAQAPDERVNQVSPTLFQKFPNPAAMAEADEAELDKIIQSISFYRQKGRNIRAMSKKLIENFRGEVPKTVEELVQLNGVGRKTANLVLANGFGIPALPVDTHVARVSQRLGFSRSSNPDLIESDLAQIFPQEKWVRVTHLLGFLGRYVCQAKNPKCWECPVIECCPFPEKTELRRVK